MRLNMRVYFDMIKVIIGARHMNKKILILPIVGSFLLTGCKISLFGKTIYLFEKPEDKKQNTVIIDDDTPAEETIEITSLSQTPNAPFYLKVGETRNVSLSISPSTGVADYKKTFTWVKSNNNIELNVENDNGIKATVKGLTEGTTNLTVTNDYNESLTKSFTIKVINFDSENEYLWEFSDRKPFGYDSKDAPQGVAEGTATLNGVDWDFSRKHTGHFKQDIAIESNVALEGTLEHKPVVPSSVKGKIGNIEFEDDGEGVIIGTGLASGGINYYTGAINLTFNEQQTGNVSVSYDCIEPYTSSLYLDNGGVTFGKSEDPETHLHFETDNNRIVEKFIIEASSNNALAKMTIKVGDTVYMDNKTVPWDSHGVIQTIIGEAAELGSGKITIDVETPEMDIDAAAQPGYRKPGAFALKSIWIKYVEETYVGIDFSLDSKHKVDYLEGEEFSWDGMKLDKISERGYRIPVNMEEARAGEDPKLTHSEIDFSEASHEAQSIELSLKVGDGDEVFKKSFDVHVRSASWVPEKLVVKGNLEDQELVAGDAVDYSNLSIDVVYEEESEDIRVAPFKESTEFAFAYGDSKDPFVAQAGMDAGYTIKVTGSYNSGASKVNVDFEVPENKIKVTDSIFDRIDFERAATFKEIDDAGLTTSAAALSYKTGKDSRICFDFSKVVKKDRASDGKTLPGVNAEFRLTALDKTLSIKEIEVKFALAGNNDNKFRLFSSIYGGDIYGSELAKASGQYLEFAEFEEHTNSLRFLPQLTSTGGLSTTNVCIESIVVRYEEKAHVEYTIDIGETAPTKLDYHEAEVFDPAGLTVTLKETGSDKSFVINSYMKWYDGSSYEENPQEQLVAGSTHVVGVFHEKTINVTINEVAELKISITLVKSVDDINATDKYYIVGLTSGENPVAAISLGSTKPTGDLDTGKGAHKFDEAFGDSYQLGYAYVDDYYQFTIDEDGYTFKTIQNGTWGVTSGGGVSNSGDCPFQKWSLSINGETGLATFEITGTSTKGEFDKILGFSGTLFSLYDTDKDKQNIYIYKVVA